MTVVEPRPTTRPTARPTTRPIRTPVEPVVTAAAPTRGPRPLARRLAFLGPAFVAGIAYVDPGNVATNFEAGSRFGYTLLWVVAAANLVAALMQSLSAKLGLATGRNLAELSRERFPRPLTLLLWGQAEIVVMATDLAELVGGALALHLLFGISLPIGALLTAVASYALISVRDRGHRPFEIVVTALFVVISAGFLYDALAARPHLGTMVAGLGPGFAGVDSVVLATAMVGATVMPHAIYVHSALTQRRGPTQPRPALRQALRLQRADIGVAMGSAGVVNGAMVVVAAAALTGVTGGIEAFHAGLARSAGGLAALLFVIALLASGLASAGVGTYAGEVVMAGYLRRQVPRVVRRCVTLGPCLLLLLCGVSATDALVFSQLVLGLGVPFALASLIVLTRNRALMGSLVNRPATTVAAALCAAGVVAIDAYSMLALLG